MRTLAKRSLAIAPAVLALLAGPALAQQNVVIFKEVPTTSELESVLFGKSAAGGSRSLSRSLSRSIRFHNPPESPRPQVTQATATATEAAPAEAAPPLPSGTALAFNILFHFDSTEVRAQSQPFLDRLGEVLTKPDNASSRIAVVGHTDATGASAYNLQLSQARAEAIREYLVGNWSVGADRLDVRGMGESRLLPGIGETDATNRRVEFVALDQGQ